MDSLYSFVVEMVVEVFDVVVVGGVVVDCCSDSPMVMRTTWSDMLGRMMRWNRHKEDLGDHEWQEAAC